ncbi:hypothetical protein [Reyranella sp. CPCC 100927]|uniref:hypothetical protein n=1 Tax=Reyranella sp. CPCC 100927 TaxID=2599616 RepID=UPI0011B759F4|nr:hypothetical protein [Reyranella sp. CPCC 100927]TWT11698.1 hypothetical protein FQU96_14585 [Reyranella sp. CPCC 100927]
MANISASFAAANQPRLPNGVETVDAFQTYVTSATLSAGDVIHFTNLKVPQGATILDVRLYGDTQDGQSIFQIGLGGGIVAPALFGSATASATPAVKTQAQALPYVVSVSDDAAVRYVYPTLTQDGAATSGTASMSLGVRVTWTMNKTR